MSKAMSGRARIEEAHGLWELATVRLTALVEARFLVSGAGQENLDSAIEQAFKDERATMANWRAVSDEVMKSGRDGN